MLELKNISYVVNDGTEEKTIIDNISLKIDERFIAFTGPNGGGKSTLAKIIMGIIKPSSGHILLDGVDITSLGITERAKMGISFAFQQPVKFKGITVTDLINIACGKKLKISEICDFLSEVGLCAREYVDREVNSSLSGGELKRIEIAMTLARESKFTLFDEPEAGIDLWSFNSLITVFERLSSKTDGTILIISHQERILNIADRIIIISDGKIKADGTKDEILPQIMSSSSCSTLMSKAKGVK